MSERLTRSNSKGILQKPGGSNRERGTKQQHINFSAAEKAADDKPKSYQGPIPPAPKPPGPVGIITGADVKDEVELHHQGVIDSHGAHNKPLGQQKDAANAK